MRNTPPDVCWRISKNWEPKSSRDPDVVGGNFDMCYEGSDWVAAAFTSVNRWRRWLGAFYGDSGIFCRRKVL